LIVHDIVLEFFRWLFDRKNYKRNGLLALKMIAGVLGVVLLAAVILFAVLFVTYLGRQH